MKRLIAVSLVLAATSLVAFTARTDTVIQGRTILPPCNFKVVSIEYANKRPMVVMRPMREGESAEVWILKPLDELEGEPAGGDSTIIVRECADIVHKP